MNTNPAGLVQVGNGRFDALFAVADLSEVRHKDQFGNDEGVSNQNPYFGDIGYARPISGLPITVGIALFAQGGFGAEFNNLATAFGTRDDVESKFRLVRITPSAAWQVNDALSLGVSIIGNYSDLDQKFFPDTSFANPVDPSQSFFGIRMSNMDTTDIGFKVGGMYKPNSRITFGAAYTSEIDLEFDGGRLTSNMSAIGLGKVTYKDVKTKPIDQPRELGIGAAIQWNEKLLLALELNWIDWSSAARKATIRAGKPDNPAAPPTLVLVTDQDWRDQYVVAVGAAYDLNDKTVVRAGYNYGRNPVPDKNLNILLSPTGVHHLPIGLGRKLKNSWRVDGAFEWNLENKTTYTNPDLPL
jgi:long-chain fatty acid transport protein